MLPQTIAVRNIIHNIEVSLQGAQAPAVMMTNILDRAQELVNNDGYNFDVALAIAVKMYPRTEQAARYAYGC